MQTEASSEGLRRASLVQGLVTAGIGLLFLLSSLGQARAADPDPACYLGIEVVDDQGGRGVPLVELQTSSGAR